MVRKISKIIPANYECKSRDSGEPGKRQRMVGLIGGIAVCFLYERGGHLRVSSGETFSSAIKSFILSGVG